MKHMDEYFAKIQKDIEKNEMRMEQGEKTKDQETKSSSPSQEEVDEGVANGYLKIDDLELDFQDMSFFENRLQMKFPNKFFEFLTDEVPNNLVYKNVATSTNCFLSLAIGQKTVDIKKTKENISKGMAASKMATKWVLEGSRKAAGNMISYCACINPAPGDLVFNFMIFPIVRDGYIAININGSGSNFEKWTLIANAMIKTMTMPQA